MVTVSQGLSHVSCSASAELHEKPGRAQVRTADPNWPKAYSRSQNAMLSILTEGAVGKWLIAAQGQAGHQSEGGEQLIWAYLVLVFIPLPFCCLQFHYYYTVIIVYYDYWCWYGYWFLLLWFLFCNFTLFQLLNSSYLKPWVFTLFWFSSQSCGRVVSEQEAVWYLVAGWG